MEGFEFPTIFIPVAPAVTPHFSGVRDSRKIISRFATVLNRKDYTRKGIITEKDFFNDP